jgi:hypothetical protein
MNSASFAPTNRAALITFLIGGPLTYVPVLLAFGGNLFALNPLTWVLGALVWILGLRNPALWLVTWIPTATAALGCSWVLRRLAETTWYARTRRTLVLIVGSALCGLISGFVYLCSSRLAVLISPVSSLQSAAPSYASATYNAGTRIATLWYGAPLVIAIGALLGGGLAWWSYPLNRSVPRPAPSTK